MRKKDGRVGIRGFVSTETAEKIRKGEIESNNGLRQAHGRASLNPEQPEFWLDDEISFLQMLKDGLKEDAVTLIRYSVNTLWYTIVLPKVFGTIKDDVVPLVERKVRLALNRVSTTKKAIAEDSTITLDESKETSNVINFAEYQETNRESVSSSVI